MKIRHGFVSNSSSSSFLVFFPYEPVSREDVRKMMYPKLTDSNIKSVYDYSLSIGDITDVVWKDIQSKQKNNIEDAIQIMDNERDDDNKDYPNEKDYMDYLTGKLDWKGYHKDCREVNRKKILEILEKRQNPEEVFYVFEYSDSDGEVLLEHGDIFENLYNITVSNH